jgi:hypothetical protein
MVAVSPAILETHILGWEAKLQASYRARWPSRLFRHEALENAVELLKSGNLLSRAHAHAALKRDVAPSEIINLTAAAHAYGRLYFRPRTPTQYRIEGIRRPDEIWKGSHAPILYMFVLKARPILTRPDVRFSQGNMQIAGTPLLQGDLAFQSLDFRKIFHEGSYPPEDEDIKVWRCAEVLCPSPLALDDVLEAVVCRSDAERRTLIHALGQQSPQWMHRIRVVTQPGYFNAEYAFVESVDLNSDAVAVKFHSRRRPPMSTWVKLTIDPVNQLIGGVHFQKQELDLRTAWNFKFRPAVGSYRVTIWIDDELAYQSVLEYADTPF